MVQKKVQGGPLRAFTIEGQEIPAEYVEIPLERIRLNPENPRLYRLRRQYPAPTPEQIRKFLLDEDGVADLKKQIRDNKGLVEPIIVDQDYTVIEGNCRTAVYLDLREGRPLEEQWKKIPAYVLPPEVTDRHIAILQAIYHVHVNKIRWGAYEQQNHLQYMRTKLKMDPPTIAKVLALSEGTVRNLLDAYDAMTKHYVAKASPGEDRKVWSYFYELFKNKKLSTFRNDANNMQMFAKLVKEKKIPRGADVRKLPDIINNLKALQKLQNENLQAAIQEVGKGDPSKVYPLFKQVRRTTKLLEKLKQDAIEELRKQPAEQKELRALYQAIKKVAKWANVALD